MSAWIVELPLDGPAPRKRLERIHGETQELDRSKQALAVEMMMKAAEYTPSVLIALGSLASSGPST